MSANKFWKWFTLLELLLVIAVITILSALLLPALKSAKAKASQIQCAGNLRQIGVALWGYSNDYNGFLPPAREGYGVGYLWSQIISSYLNKTSSEYCGRHYLRCPSERDNAVHCYGVNYYTVFSYPLTTPGINYSKKLDLLPASAFMVMDCGFTWPLVLYPGCWFLNIDMDGDGLNDSNSGAGILYNAASFRHGKAANMLHSDVHVSRNSLKDWINNKDNMWYANWTRP